MRQKAYEIVYGVLEQDKHSDELFHSIVAKESITDSRDKRFLKRLAYGTIERAIESDARINQVASLSIRKMKPTVRTVLRMAVYEIYYMDNVPEAASCHEAVELLKKTDSNSYTAFVNGVLRTIIRKSDELTLRYPWQSLCLPKELYEYFVDSYGKKTAKKIGQAFLAKEAEVTLHIDVNKISRTAYEQKLIEAGVEFCESHYIGEALRVRHVENVTTLPGYEEGLFFVQDESSMLPVVCADIKPGAIVVDVCSSPGGKTMHALTRLQGQGFVCARDISEKKIKRVTENVTRMKYNNVQYKVWDGTVKDKEWENRADVVLVDVPCSGIGIIGRKPEIKYRALQSSKQLVPIQRDICKTAVNMLRPGGVLIYSTCTINKEENEENVSFLENSCQLIKESLDAYLPEVLHNKMTAEGMLQMLPGIHKSDGFFVARFRKE